jgi:hypothetical protein
MHHVRLPSRESEIVDESADRRLVMGKQFGERGYLLGGRQGRCGGELLLEPDDRSGKGNVDAVQVGAVFPVGGAIEVRAQL